MSKSHFKISNSHMARRIFRRSKSAQLFSLEMAMDTSGLDEICSGLPQDRIEILCNFRMEANLLRAQTGAKAITVDEAVRFLKATNFNAPKSIEIYKNYQKSQDTYQLQNLRPHREPLSSAIGSKKMEIVGTQDAEGSPIVLFTVSRHEAFRSDHKADMQLLFYTLDQAAENEAAQEKGIVFIIDMRNSLINDIRYSNSVLSVLREGYPVNTKMIYVVTSTHVTKAATALLKVVKYDMNKVKFVNLSELKSHFLPEQLPLSLEGTFVTSPSHQSRLKGGVKDDLSISSHKPMYPHGVRRGSGGSGVKDVKPSLSDGRSVNQLLGMFESGHDHQDTTNKPPPSSHSSNKPLPTPPAKANPAAKLLPTPSKKPVQQSDSFPAFKVALKKARATEGQSTEGESGGKARVPLLPPSNGRGHVVNKAASVDSTETTSSSKSSESSKFTRSGSGGDEERSSVAVAMSRLTTRTQAAAKKVISNMKSAATRSSSGNSDELSTSWNAGGSPPESNSRRRADSADKAGKSSTESSPTKSRKPRVPVQPLPYPSKKEKSTGPPAKEVSGQTRKETQLKINKNSSSGSSSAKETSTHQPQPPPSPSQRKSKPQQKPPAYENVDLPKAPLQGRPHPQPPPVQSPPPRPEDEYENTTFSNRDSDVYENIGIGFAGTGSNITGPLPPLPPSRYHDDKQPYMNLEIVKCPTTTTTTTKGKVMEESVSPVEEDDEVLFGKEGPPGMQETIYENFGPDKGNRFMTADELAAHVEKLGKKGLSTEYYKIRNEPITGPHKACRLPCNTPKNRYRDVICYDETRVHLSSYSGKEGSDYIHANYVDGFKKPSAFILTQGPKDKTVADFWRMIWEKNVLVIVMVTKCVELGKRKCAQYWPEKEGEVSKYGNFAVTVSDVQNSEGYDIRTMHLSFKDSKRTVMHFQFLAWPDYGIPSSGSDILSLIFDVREAQSKSSRGSKDTHPMVVHCSAGVGRSGAFCSIDNCIHELDEQKKVNLQATVRKMRKQRAYSIQTDEQYEFAYQTLLEYSNNKKTYKK